jgi:hypothetical protein
MTGGEGDKLAGSPSQFSETVFERPVDAREHTMKKNKDSKREPLTGAPDAAPEGGSSKSDTSKASHKSNAGKKPGNRKPNRSAEDDGMPSGSDDPDRGDEQF